MDSLAIEFAPGALNAIKVQVIRGCKPTPRGYAEVGGLLCGAIVEFPGSTVVRIDSIIPVMLEPPDGRASHLSNADKWYLSKAIQDCASRPLIGWYRSQTQPDNAAPESSGAILDEDRASSAEFFPKGKTAFLICNPDKDFNLPGRLCIWTAGKAEVLTGVSLGPCAPVLNPERHPRPARHRPLLKAPDLGAMSATVSDAVSRQWSAVAEALSGAVAFLWRRSGRVLAFTLPPVIAIAAFMFAGKFRAATHESVRPKPTSLGMKAYRVGNEMFLNWNRSAAEILQAENGNLTIVDDGRRRELKLTPKDLQTGSLTCQADGDDVRLELDVVGRAGDFVESLRVVGESPPVLAATVPVEARVPRPVEIKPTIPDKAPKQEPVAPPRQPEPRTVTVAAPEPKAIAAPPQPKPKQVEKAPIVAPQPIYKPAVVIPQPEKPPARQPVPNRIATATREAPRVIVQPPPKSAPKSVVSVLSKPAPSRSAINQPAAIRPVVIRKDLPRKDPPRLPVQEQRKLAETLPREKAEEYVKPRAIQSPQPTFDDSAKVAIDRVLSQGNEAHEVRVQVNIDEHGSVVQASVASTTGPFASLFVDSALDAARRWQFKPASLDGRPVASNITLRFNFVRKSH